MASASTRMSIGTIEKHLEILRTQEAASVKAVSVKQAALDQVQHEIRKYEEIRCQKLAKNSRFT